MTDEVDWYGGTDEDRNRVRWWIKIGLPVEWHNPNWRPDEKAVWYPWTKEPEDEVNLAISTFTPYDARKEHETPQGFVAGIRMRLKPSD